MRRKWVREVTRDSQNFAASGPRVAGVSGALLLGGASRRMGRDKAGLVVGGVAMGRRALAVLLGLFDDVLTVDRPGRPARRTPPGARRVLDPADAPPAALAGIATALAAARHRWVFVLACDMPFPHPALIRGLALRARAGGNRARVVAPSVGGVLHPLCAVYHGGLLPEVRARLAAGNFRVQDLARTHGEPVDEATLRGWDPDLAGLVNVNTPEELRAARAARRRTAAQKGQG